MVTLIKFIHSIYISCVKLIHSIYTLCMGPTLKSKYFCLKPFYIIFESQHENIILDSFSRGNISFKDIISLSAISYAGFVGLVL